MLDDGIVNGTGVGQLLGILNSGCLVTVNKETGQHAATVMAENVIKMDARILGSGESAVWLCNKNIKPQLYTMSIAVGTGGVPITCPLAESVACPTAHFSANLCFSSNRRQPSGRLAILF